VKPGRRRKPTNLRVIEGNRGHRPLNLDEPKFARPPDMPEPPSFMDTFGLEEWARVAPELYATGLLTTPDASALAGYCMAFSRWRTAEEAIQVQARVDDKVKHGGLVQVTKDGNVIQNVLVGIANKARQDMIRAAAEFGLTPSARANLKGSQRGDEDPTEKKFFGLK
jgi:P27 family predicted phage terminase small subunit